MVLEIFSEDDFNSELRTCKGLLIVDFYADWCGPCKSIAPVFYHLSEQYSDVKFIKVNTDTNAFCAKLGVSALPTFHFYLNTTLVDSMQGADSDQLTAKIHKHRLGSTSKMIVPSLSNTAFTLLQSTSTNTNQSYHDHVDEHIASMDAKQSFINAVRFNMRAQAYLILQESPSFANEVSSLGYFSVHWAAKQGSIDMLKLLSEFGADLHMVSENDDRICPIHWAAYDGKIAVLKYLLSMPGSDIDIQDGNGATPLICAVKNNQPDAVIYLLKNGADIRMKDNVNDTSLHWAAHQGYDQVVALLLYFNSEDIGELDDFGQSPLHLASLKGHVECVQYLLKYAKISFNDYKLAKLYHKDSNGETPLDLAIHKRKYKSEWVIRQALYNNNTYSILYSIGVKRLWMCWRVFIPFVVIGFDQMETAVWMWRFVFWSNAIASYTTIIFAMDILMRDLTILLALNIILQILWWNSFFSCLKHPGHIREPVTNSEYEKGLDFIGSSGEDITPYQLCHTCHLRKPLRSKHDRCTNQCIYKFDHFCPFVGNAVGRDNYKYFISLLTLHAICSFLWEITAFLYAYRHSDVSWAFHFFRVYALGMATVTAALLGTHINLIRSGYTTNEFINRSRYAYLMSSNGQYFDNPFLKKSVLLNIMEVFVPDKRVFYTKEEVLEAEGVEPFNSTVDAYLV